MAATLSIIVPTLNAAGTLGATLAALAAGLDVVIVDGGSTDGTVEIARAAGAVVESALRGRGVQLAHGAARTTAPWLLFLHADTVLEPGWYEAARGFMADPTNQQRAACFRFGLDDEGRAARRLERIVAWRTSALGLPYGDQGLLIARSLYDALGGFRPIPIMEDVDLVRRIGCRHIVLLEAVARTSAARYRRDGYVWRPARNLSCLALYFLGVPPALIARLYGRRRRA